MLKDLEDLEDWSFCTAAMAYFSGGGLSLQANNRELLEEVTEAWESAPICTSVAIIFWQKYLRKQASILGEKEAKLIRKWMPVRADCTLPSTLADTLLACAWTRFTVCEDFASI